ncbi:hypothetical protein GCM10020001_095440 [Nonomuraea salmonea]
MMMFMTITFITGANKGLGRETARRLIALGHTVLLGARDPERGAEVAAALGARFVPIDVTDDASVAAAAKDVAEHEGRIDVLINNAGIHGPFGDPSTLTGPVALGVFDVNVAGVVRATTAFLPLLRRSPEPRIVNVSSGMGSLALTHDPSRPRVEGHRAPLHRLQGRPDDADHPIRQVPARHPRQRRRPRLHRHRPERPHRPPRPSPRARTPSSPWPPNPRSPAPAASSAAPAKSPGPDLFPCRPAAAVRLGRAMRGVGVLAPWVE